VSKDVQDRPMGRPKGLVETVVVSVRLPKPLADEAKEIADMLSTADLTASTTDAYRAAIVRGFAAIRADHAKKAKR